jgi:hypothetical protein
MARSKEPDSKREEREHPKREEPAPPEREEENARHRPRESARWPSLEEQLEASKVIRGSALEKLIRENQDFEMLRPEEAHDKLRLPPWLRVYWKKQHPELRPAPHDPTGGYPLALRDIYIWMLGHQDLKPPRESESEKGGENGD